MNYRIQTTVDYFCPKETEIAMMLVVCLISDDPNMSLVGFSHYKPCQVKWSMFL